MLRAEPTPIPIEEAAPHHPTPGLCEPSKPHSPASISSYSQALRLVSGTMPSPPDHYPRVTTSLLPHLARHITLMIKGHPFRGLPNSPTPKGDRSQLPFVPLLNM